MREFVEEDAIKAMLPKPEGHRSVPGLLYLPCRRQHITVSKLIS